MIEHPHPSPATAKSLYARALRCAHPNCSEPLYRQDELSGEWTLNSRICHIHARREGGPRWNHDQTPEENRSESNLLLMCTRHAAAIDDPANVGSYPDHTLLEWKRHQIEEHKKAIGGWPLTDRMAEEALSQSFPDFNLTLLNSNLALGGEGGKAPGSGGGGGGAIGPGARGGSGGKGGNIIQVNDRYPNMLETLLANMNNAEHPAPGSGGSGAEAFGPGSIGGDGGNGGDCITAAIKVEKGDTFEIEVGEGGKGAQFPGKHGQAGGDTVLIHRSEDGRVKACIPSRRWRGSEVWSAS